MGFEIPSFHGLMIVLESIFLPFLSSAAWELGNFWGGEKLSSTATSFAGRPNFHFLSLLNVA